MTAATHTLIAKDAEALLAALPIEAQKLRTQRVFVGTGVTLVRLSMDVGQILKEHVSTTPILVQVLTGSVSFGVGTERIDMSAGAIIQVEANVPHSVEALVASHLLLTLLGRGGSGRGADS